MRRQKVRNAVSEGDPAAVQREVLNVTAWIPGAGTSIPFLIV